MRDINIFVCIVLLYLGLFFILYATMGNARTCPNPYLRGAL